MEEHGYESAIRVLRTAINHFIQKNGCTILREDNDGIEFTYPPNENVSKVFVGFQPENGKVSYWFERTDGTRGVGWQASKWDHTGKYYPDESIGTFSLSAIEKYPSVETLLKNAFNQDIDYVLSDSEKPRIIGIKERPDLAPKSQGASYSANFYVYHIYEIEGENLTGDSLESIMITKWLGENGYEYLIRPSYSKHLTHTKNWREWRDGKWIITSRTFVNGD